ncbi:ribosomal RNA small subunit methyltransferase H [Solanum tuberosum]|uniref:S-adenosyl-methyltransferase mraw n=2 Tax=Solanum tuberosum TaxID=4113 RepID=M0ZXJ8_SOLTU|nr:PREDICTED: ribosomal RNA small subunit methyltransferase H [Solanum tuberosum]
MARVVRNLLFRSSAVPPPFKFHDLRLPGSFSFSTSASIRSKARKNKGKNLEKSSNISVINQSKLSQVKRRTRSEKELDEEAFLKNYGNENSAHVPVLLGEVLDVFTSVTLRSFLDCTLGAAGHSSAIIRAHPEMQVYVGLDVDPIAHEKAQSQLKSIIDRDSFDTASALKVHTFLKNFKDVKSVLGEVADDLLTGGVNGILMDLGMSSMQVNDAGRGFSVLKNGPLDMRMNPKATLKAEDILNSWPTDEVGRVLREYGEESNWYSLQNRIVKARLHGGLHSTNDLVDLIQNSTSRTKGRQGWIKTATRVFQALRIAVNDELKTLEDSIRACFESLSSGGRLAVISFHSLEDRIVKQTFLDIMNCSEVDGGVVEDEEGKRLRELRKINLETVKEEAWIKQVIQGQNGTILTKRPITPSEKEETLNPRSRSAKLRVIQKA